MFWTRKRSFTYNVNSTGPKMDPSGAPTVKGRGRDEVLQDVLNVQ